MNLTKNFFSRDLLEKLSAFLLVAIFIYIFKGMINILLLTFVFSFFLYMIQNFLYINLRKLVRVERKIVIAFVFLLLVAAISYFLYRYIPVVIDQFNAIVEQLQDFDVSKLEGTLSDNIINIINKVDIKQYIQTGSSAAFKTITNIGKLGFDIFISLILSFFFIIEKDEVINFGRRIDHSKLAGPFKSIKYFTKSFLNSFSKVMQAQLLIAFVNSILSIIALSIRPWINDFSLRAYSRSWGLDFTFTSIHNCIKNPGSQINVLCLDYDCSNSFLGSVCSKS